MKTCINRTLRSLLLAAIVAALVISACACCYVAGRRSGINHAILHSEIFTVERYDPENPEDQTVYLELDGDVHEYIMWQG